MKTTMRSFLSWAVIEDVCNLIICLVVDARLGFPIPRRMDLGVWHSRTRTFKGI